MWPLFAISATIIAAAWAYGFSKTSSKNQPIPQGDTRPIVVGDLIDVDIVKGAVIVPGKTSGTVGMRVASLDVTGDIFKKLLLATFVFPPELINQPAQAVKRAGCSLFSPVLAPRPSASPAAIQAAKQIADGTPIITQPKTVAEVIADAEQARIDAMTKLVPESTTPEALATLIALSNIPPVESQKP